MGSRLDAICPSCGAHYRDLRTGLTFGEVRGRLWVYQDDPRAWRYKRRHTVLGHWHQIKQRLWKSHLAICGEAMRRME